MPDFNKTSNFWTYILKTLKYQISCKSFIENQVAARGQTDGHDEANSFFFQF
jgi:hypothetical protein